MKGWFVTVNDGGWYRAWLRGLGLLDDRNMFNSKHIYKFDYLLDTRVLASTHTLIKKVTESLFLILNIFIPYVQMYMLF